MGAALEIEHACSCGVEDVDALILKALRVDIRKVLDPLDPDDYLTIVGRLSRAMIRSTAETEATILRSALDTLDVDWPNMTEAGRDKIIAAARGTYSNTAEAVIPAITQEVRVSGPRVVRGARRGTRRQLPARLRSRVGISLSLGDKRILKHLVGSQAIFVTDEYTRRLEEFSTIAKSIVEADLAVGIGREDITANLNTAIGDRLGPSRSRNYWSVIAATFTNRSRTWGQLASYQDAGIERYVFEAVLDERTTDQCAFLHGRTFSVGSAVARYQRSERAEDPQDVKEIMPWLQAGRDAEGNRILYMRDREGNRTQVAEVTQSRVGEVDSTGRFKNAMSTAQLEAAGIQVPPLHGRCRSTIVADV